MQPLWFVTMLLIFDFGYDLWRMLTKNLTSYSIGKSSLPSDLLVGVFILALALATLTDHSQMYSFTEQPAIEG
jgi:hypothetical protein